MAPNYGTPADIKPEPPKTAVLRTVALGFTQGAEAPQLPPGVTSKSTNWLDVDGGLIPRPGIRVLGPASGTGSVASTISEGPYWVGEGVTGTGGRYPALLSYKFPAVFNGTSWSTLSQVGPAGLSGNTLHSYSGSVKHFDATRYYNPVSDEFELCFATSSASGGVYTWRPGTAVFSNLTNSPAAGLVCAFDNRLLFSRITSAGTFYPQRVQWSARGDPVTYTTPDGGFEELMDSNGVITRLWPETDRVLVFFDQEIWQGYKIAFPFNFQFTPLDRTVGCPAPRSVARTPRGTMFLGSDLNLYLIPPGGGPQSMPKSVQRLLRDELNYIEWGDPDTTRVYGLYDETRNGYLLVYDKKLTGTYTHGIFVNLDAGTASPIVFRGGSTLEFTPQYRCLGETHLAESATTTIQRQRIMLGNGLRTLYVGEYTSDMSCEVTFGPSPAYSILTTFGVDHQRDLLIPNPNPYERQFVRELRLDYRGSASSLTVQQSNDFGANYHSTALLALPANAISAQTWCPGGSNAVYPAVNLSMSGFTNIAIQGVTAVVETMGNG